ncbi:MAG: Ig-like domain-containing protein, partial [Thermoleophilaceae bacterium]
MKRLVVAGLALAGIGAEPAAAGTFHVYGLGLNGAGCPNAWQAQQAPADRFRQGNYCSRWEIQSVRDGTALQQGAFAGTSMFAGTGARFTGFSIKSHGTARNGTSWKMAMCATPFASCTGWFPQSGTWGETEYQLGSLSPGGSPIYAQHLWAGASCDASSCADSSAAGRAVQITHLESHAVVDDYTPPGAPSLGGVSTGWNSGQKQLTYSASDAGSGIESATLTVDGSLHRTNNHSCTRLPTGGYTQPVPCATSTSGQFTLNEPGQLADGRHTLSVTSRDAGGATAASAQEFWVDNNAPGDPLTLQVDGGDGWRDTNDFSLTWQNPDQGSGSPIAAAYYKIGSAPETPTDGTRVPGEALTRIDSLRVPRDGDWTIHVWLEDAAGNADQGRLRTAKLRLDTTSPTLAFLNERSAPAEVRVETSDEHSGVTGGLVQIRQRGIADWRSLETRREGTDLVAAIPDDQFERGTYELQATATDAVGNSATTSLRKDGRE